jgi:tetratricopeptide (TPR) repeat protein
MLESLTTTSPSRSPHGRELLELDLLLLEARLNAGQNVHSALDFARQVQAKHTQSELATSGVLMLAEFSAERGEIALADTLASEVIGRAKDVEVLARALRLRARLLERAGDWAGALATLRELQLRYPVSAPALRSHLDPVDHFVHAGDETAASEALQRAEQALGDFLRSYPVSPQTELAQELLAETLIRLGKREEAIQALLDFADRCAGTPREAMLLLFAAQRSGETAEGQARSAELYERIARDFPNTFVGRRSLHEARRLRSAPP